WVVRGAIAPMGLSRNGETYCTAVQAAAELPSSFRSPMFPFTMPKSGPVQVWDVETGREVLSVLGETVPKWRVALAPNGKRLIALAERSDQPVEDELLTIDLTTGQEKRTTIAARTEQWQVHFSPQNDLVLLENWRASEKDADLHLYDANSLRHLVSMAV